MIEIKVKVFYRMGAGLMTGSTTAGKDDVSLPGTSFYGMGFEKRNG